MPEELHRERQSVTERHEMGGGIMSLNINQHLTKMHCQPHLWPMCLSRLLIDLYSQTLYGHCGLHGALGHLV
jgi:hypothetical protein